MSFIKKNALGPKGMKEKEIESAAIERQAALLEFVAIMTDVELPEDDTENANYEEEEEDE